MAAASVSSASHVRVAVRIRPPLPTEDDQTCVQALDDGKTIEIYDAACSRYDHAVRHEFDGCHGSAVGQAELYAAEIRALLPAVFTGHSVSVFAYGNTGAGKTYTMQGSAAEPGIIPRAVDDLFASIDRTHRAASLTMSFLEIYNERVVDLLEAGGADGPADLPIRESAEHGIHVAGLSAAPLSSAADFHRLYAQGCANRSTGATKLNATSSRSHAVLQLAVTVPAPSGRATLKGKLCLIDLAGSEDNRRTGNAGARLLESGAINKSLFVLGKVIDAINRGDARVPYRDSKLTRLLQDALGGRAHAVMIANIGPARAFFYESANTLNFAAKSRTVVNEPRANVQRAPPVAAPTRAELLAAFKASKEGGKEGGKDGAKETARPLSAAAPSTRAASRLSTGSNCSASSARSTESAALQDAAEALHATLSAPRREQAQLIRSSGLDANLQARVESLEARLQSQGVAKGAKLIAAARAAKTDSERLALYAAAREHMPEDSGLGARIDALVRKIESGGGGGAEDGSRKRKRNGIQAGASEVAAVRQPLGSAAAMLNRQPTVGRGAPPAVKGGGPTRVLQAACASASASDSSSYRAAASGSESDSDPAPRKRRAAKKSRRNNGKAAAVPLRCTMTAVAGTLPAEMAPHGFAAEARVLAVLNHGDVRELTTLETVGKTRAQTIVERRERVAAEAAAGIAGWPADRTAVFESLADLGGAGFTARMIETFFDRNVIDPALAAVRAAAAATAVAVTAPASAALSSMVAI